MSSKVKLGWNKKVFYEYTIPSIPKESEIAGFDLKKEEQYWRNICPKMPNVKYMSALDKQQFVEREFIRSEEGFWFMNGGEPTYITGAHYEHLTHNRFAGAPNGGQMDYRTQQRDNFYFRDLVWNDENCYGDLKIKPRRIGASAEEMTHSLYIATHDKERYIGLMSTSEDDTYEILYDPIAHILRYRHPLLKPIFNMPTGRMPKSKLDFDNFRIDNADNGITTLGSAIMVGKTSIKTFDGTKKHKIVFDECWKWRISPKATLAIHKPVIYDNGKIIGKISMVSTMGDDDKVMEEAIKDGLELWADSDPTMLNENNQTKSGLYKWFIPSQSSIANFIDKYGNVDEARTLEYIHNERAKYEVGSPEYVGEIRRFPINEEEVLGTSSLKTTFDTIRINARLGNILKLATPQKPYMKGKFVENPTTGKVEFVKDPEGRWKVCVIPHEKARNRYKKSSWNGIEPFKDCEFGIGIDPVRWARTVSNQLSKQSIIVIQKYKFDWDNESSDVVTHQFRFAALYNSRESTPTETYEQCILASKYYGAPTMIERQVDALMKFYEEKGMMSFLQRSKYDGETGLMTSKKSTEDGIDALQEFIFRTPKSDSENDYLGENDVAIPFEEVLEQAKNFDINKTRKFDVMMSLIMAMNSIEQLKPIRMNNYDSISASKILSTINPIMQNV